MAKVLDWNENLIKKPITQLKPDMELLKLIYKAPVQVVDNDYYLGDIIGNGFHSAALCEALGVKQLEILFNDEVHILNLTQPPFGLTHYDIMFQTEKAKRENFII
jgi:hypothetical protein